MQNNRENMPEVTSRAQGTKKESGRTRWNSEKPEETRIPDGYHPQIAYIVKERSWGGAGKQYSSNANVILASETVSDTPELSTRLHKDSYFKIRVFCFTAESSSVSEKSRRLGFLGFALGKLGKLVVLTRGLALGSCSIKPADGSPVKCGPETEPNVYISSELCCEASSFIFLEGGPPSKS